jgi:hypothetical protein
MRKLEIQANEAFDTYREMYYEGGVSSVYLWDPEDPSGVGNFAGVVVIKKGEVSDKCEIQVSDSCCLSDESEYTIRTFRWLGLYTRL